MRRVDATLEIATHLAGVPPHPPAVPGQQRYRAEDDDERDDVGADVRERAAERADRDAHGDRREDGEGAAERDVAATLGMADLRKIGVDNAEQQRGLEALAQDDDERRAHRLLRDD